MENLVTYGLQFDKQNILREIKLKIQEAFK